jgi:hypothetical protein
MIYIYIYVYITKVIPLNSYSEEVSMIQFLWYIIPLSRFKGHAASLDHQFYQYNINYIIQQLYH